MTFGPDGAYGHPDHIAISQFTTAARMTTRQQSIEKTLKVIQEKTEKALAPSALAKTTRL